MVELSVVIGTMTIKLLMVDVVMGIHILLLCAAQDILHSLFQVLDKVSADFFRSSVIWRLALTIESGTERGF
jgi:hypothetical protein